MLQAEKNIAAIRQSQVKSWFHTYKLCDLGQDTLHLSGLFSSSTKCVCVCMLSHVQLFATPWTIAHQAALSMEFSRQEYWSELQFPTLGDLPEPGIELKSLVPPALAGRLFTT